MCASPPCFLAISGSIRARSVNTAVLKALARLAAPEVTVLVYDGLADLPHFNPDLDTDLPPAAVRRFRQQVATSTGLIISTPEYAHGVPGVLKNALDWLVSDETFGNKPVALINPRPRSTWAITSLRETLTVMSARLVDRACVSVALDHPLHDEEALLARPEVSAVLRTCIAEMIAAS